MKIKKIILIFSSIIYSLCVLIYTIGRVIKMCFPEFFKTLPHFFTLLVSGHGAVFSAIVLIFWGFILFHFIFEIPFNGIE